MSRGKEVAVERRNWSRYILSPHQLCTDRGVKDICQQEVRGQETDREKERQGQLSLLNDEVCE